jgi:hypothetical protein
MSFVLRQRLYPTPRLLADEGLAWDSDKLTPVYSTAPSSSPSSSTIPCPLRIVGIITLRVGQAQPAYYDSAARRMALSKRHF